MLCSDVDILCMKPEERNRYSEDLTTIKYIKKKMTEMDWNKLICDCKNVQLNGTLNGGQSFRWKKKVLNNEEEEEEEMWIGVFNDCVWMLIQKPDHILYKVIERKEEQEGGNSYYNQALHNYFQLDLNLKHYYERWCESDPYFKLASKQFYGIRILAQDPIENIFSFICSTNNHITRISKMIEKMCALYGKKICTLNDETTYYTFPDVESLAQPGVENALREAGFGYRAAYIFKSAKKLLEMSGGGEGAVKSIIKQQLKRMDYLEARKTLMSLAGVGPKVADCVCLMSLGHLQAIPVDTHVYQIAQRYYNIKHISKNQKKQKTVTDKMYNEIGDYFRNMYGPLAGWAHVVLFCADLKMFQKK